MCFVAAGRAVRAVDVEGSCLKKDPLGLPLGRPLSVIPWKDVYSSVASDG